jgi:hypothetical protein
MANFFLFVCIFCSLQSLRGQERIVKDIRTISIDDLKSLNQKYAALLDSDQVIPENYYFETNESIRIYVFELEIINKTYVDIQEKVLNISNYHIIMAVIDSRLSIAYKYKKDPRFFRNPFVIYEIIYDVDISTKEIQDIYYGR